MKFIWDPESGMPLGNIIATGVILVLIYVLLGYTFSKVTRRRPAFIFLTISFILTAAAFVCYLIPAMVIIGTFSAAGISICLFTNIGDLRKFLAAPFHRDSVKAVNVGVAKIFDSKAFYEQVGIAVNNLSKSKIGALMTFEKSTSLSDLTKNGVQVHAPFSPELIMTIFYPGTRLHDGAVVIKGNEIVSAAVFYTPSTKAFAGKYGSRHRAAIGISEISDSVTVVVSEETGRISFAVNGELETCDPQNFVRVLETYMSVKEENAEE